MPDEILSRLGRLEAGQSSLQAEVGELRGLPEQRRRLKKILDFVSKNALEPEAYEEIKPDIAAL